MLKPEFSSFGNTIKVYAKLSELSGRDKVQLFQALMEELGITARLHQEQETARAQAIIAEQWNLHWKD